MYLVRHGSTAIVIVRTMLQSLGLQSLRSVPYGRIFIGFNSRLCYADTVNWEMITGRAGVARLKMNGQECGMSLSFYKMYQCTSVFFTTVDDITVCRDKVPSCDIEGHNPSMYRLMRKKLCNTRRLMHASTAGERIFKIGTLWRSYRQNGLIASHALFEVHCPGERCRFRQITCV